MGLEEDVVFSLLQRAEPIHRLRTAFTRGSIRGSVYLEAAINPSLLKLLLQTPGVICTREGVTPQGIEPSDWLALLIMKEPKFDAQLDRWVRVLRGAYKGDSGLVVGVKPWGVEVLLIPRLRPPVTNAIGSLKRKRSVDTPSPALFDPVSFKATYGISPKKQADNCYTVSGNVFEHGLLRKRYDFHSISYTTVDMPSHHLLYFDHSCHPSIRSFPRPREWVFEEGEPVLFRHSSDGYLHYHTSPDEKGGVVKIVAEHGVEVEFVVEEGVKAVRLIPWRNIRKDIEIGDYVKILRGTHTGAGGWVIHIENDIAHISNTPTDGSVMDFDTLKVLLYNTVEPRPLLTSPTELRNSCQLGQNCLYPILTRTWSFELDNPWFSQSPLGWDVRYCI